MRGTCEFQNCGCTRFCKGQHITRCDGCGHGDVWHRRVHSKGNPFDSPRDFARTPTYVHATVHIPVAVFVPEARTVAHTLPSVPPLPFCPAWETLPV